jgi:hypothetical protein
MLASARVGLWIDRSVQVPSSLGPLPRSPETDLRGERAGMCLADEKTSQSENINRQTAAPRKLAECLKTQICILKY